jgi:hypothetical protein
MPRFYFHLRDDGRLLEDSEGEELEHLGAVRLQAMESARQILSEAALSGKALNLNQQIEVMDDAGKTILTVPVGHAVGTDAQR